MDNLMKNNETTDNDRKSIAIVIHVIYSIMLLAGLAAGLSVGNEFMTMAIVFTVIAAVGVCLANGFKELYKTLGIVLVVSIVFNFVLTKEMLQKNRIENAYSSFIYQNKNYENTENGQILKKALEGYTTENYNAALKLLRNYDENYSQDLDKVVNLVTAIKQITPELIPDLKAAMNDNFVSIQEYRSLRQKTIKNITLAKLTNEQLVLLGSIK
jgi:energy-coupling factor transporter transmembrane protein EcfT